MIGGQAYTVTVASSALSELILAVHQSAAGSGSASERLWRFENVIGIVGGLVRDLDLRSVRAKYAVRAPIAAVTVIAHRRIAVDVVFEVAGAEASARFLCASEPMTADPVAPANPERSWAEYLVAATCEVLAAVAIPVRMRGPNASE